MCASSLRKSYSLILIWDENDACLLPCFLHAKLGTQQADTPSGQGEEHQLFFKENYFALSLEV